MKIILATNNHPMSVGIREETHSKYSHGGVLDGDDVIEARPKAGVVRTPLKVFKRLYPIYEVREAEGSVLRAIELLGKPYDYEGLIGQAHHVHNIQDDNAYFCSEVLGYALDGVNSKESHRLLPDHFIALSYPIAVVEE